MAKAKGKGEVPNKKSKSDRIEDIVDQQQQQQPHNDADDESDSVNNNNNNTSTDKKNKKPSKTTTSKKSSKSSADEGSSDEAKRNGRNGTTTTTTKQSTMGAMERAAAKRKSAKKANQSKTGGNEEDDRAITPDTTVNNNNNNKTDETKNKNKIDEDVDSDDDVFVKKEPKPATPGSRLHGIIWIVVVVSILILTIALRIGEDVYTNTRAYTGEEPQFIDYYATLEVPKTATAEEIKKAYRKLAIKWHPDRNPDCGKKCEDKVSELSEAYDVLSYPDTRKFHDTYGVKPPPNLLKLAKMKHGGSARNRKGGGDE